VCWAALSAGDLGWGPLDGGSPSGNFSHPSQWGSLGDPGWDTERLTSRYGSAVLRPITPRRQAPTRHRPHLAPPYATPNPFCLPRLHDKPQSQRQRNREGQREEEWGLPPPRCQPLARSSGPGPSAEQLGRNLVPSNARLAPAPFPGRGQTRYPREQGSVPVSRSRAPQNTPQNQPQIFPLPSYPRWGKEKGCAQHRDAALETLNDRGEMGRNRQRG